MRAFGKGRKAIPDCPAENRAFLRVAVHTVPASIVDLFGNSAQGTANRREQKK